MSHRRSLPLCDLEQVARPLWASDTPHGQTCRSELTRSSNRGHRSRGRNPDFTVPMPAGFRSRGVIRVQAARLPSQPRGCHSMQYVRPWARAGHCIVVPATPVLTLRAPGSGRRQASASGYWVTLSHPKAPAAPSHPLAKL